MEEYLQLLNNKISNNNLSEFCVLLDIKPFKIIKKTKTQMERIMVKDCEKYQDKTLAVISLLTRPIGFKLNDYIFAINIGIYKIHQDGKLNKNILEDSYNSIYKYIKCSYGISLVDSDSWGISLKYLPSDLEKYPFKMKNMEEYINLVYKKKIYSSLNGIYYADFKTQLQIMKEANEKQLRPIYDKNYIYRKELY
jgi:hypothetical protein